MKMHRSFAIVIALVLLVVPALPGLAAPVSSQVVQTSLEFDINNFTVESVDVGGEPIIFRAYRGIVYVSNPTEIVFPQNTIYQKLNVYVPIEISLDDYNTHGGPIFLPNTVGGYNPGLPAEPTRNEVKTALAKGYVVVAPGARGRTNYDSVGIYNGKAPAAIVDLKAAVRYLRYNDEIMPGDAEKIVSSGTSAGGALSTLLGATGNNPDYEPYLQAIGAANERDDIFATNAYCPITNLDNADMAYEWYFYGLNDYYFLGGGTMTGDRLVVSKELKDLFPGYLNSLGLRFAIPVNYDGFGLLDPVRRIKPGFPLFLDANGEGNFKLLVKTYVMDSAQTALDSGVDLSAFPWITIVHDRVKDIDMDAYLVYVRRMKPAPAFDGLYNPSWENNLFGTATISDQHFSNYMDEAQYRFDGTWIAPLADWGPVKMLNPMYYIGDDVSDSSYYWRIRHGAIDADTALPVPIILATKLMNTGHNVNFAVPWGQGHGGNYDLEALFDWIAAISE